MEAIQRKGTATEKSFTPLIESVAQEAFNDLTSFWGSFLSSFEVSVEDKCKLRFLNTVGSNHILSLAHLDTSYDRQRFYVAIDPCLLQDTLISFADGHDVSEEEVQAVVRVIIAHEFGHLIQKVLKLEYEGDSNARDLLFENHADQCAGLFFKEQDLQKTDVEYMQSFLENLGSFEKVAVLHKHFLKKYKKSIFASDEELHKEEVIIGRGQLSSAARKEHFRAGLLHLTPKTSLEYLLRAGVKSKVPAFQESSDQMLL